MKKHKRVKAHKKNSSQKVIVLFFLGLLVFASIVLFKNSGQSVLGTTIGSSGIEGQPTSTPTTKQIIQPTSEPLPTVEPTIEPTIVVNPTQTTVQNPPLTPTPTVVVPQDPIFVPVIDPTKQDPAVVDIAAEKTTVIIESTTTGLTTTTEQLTSKTEPVTQTTITSQTSQASTVSEPSAVDKFIALLSGQSQEVQTVQETSTVKTATEQPKSENQPILYQQVYVPDASATSYTTDSTETVAALNKWLGLNDTTLSSSNTDTFTISQGDVTTLITPKDNKIAINMSRMEILVNTDYGFMPLSYSSKRATEYAQDLNLISHVTGDIKVHVTPTELVYDVQGVSDQYFLAFIGPIPVSKQLEISAKSNQILNVKQSFISKVLDLFSI